MEIHGDGRHHVLAILLTQKAGDERHKCSKGTNEIGEAALKDATTNPGVCKGPCLPQYYFRPIRNTLCGFGDRRLSAMPAEASRIGRPIQGLAIRPLGVIEGYSFLDPRPSAGQDQGSLP